MRGDGQAQVALWSPTATRNLAQGRARAKRGETLGGDGGDPEGVGEATRVATGEGAAIRRARLPGMPDDAGQMGLGAGCGEIDTP